METKALTSIGETPDSGMEKLLASVELCLKKKKTMLKIGHLKSLSAGSVIFGVAVMFNQPVARDTAPPPPLALMTAVFDKVARADSKLG